MSAVHHLLPVLSAGDAIGDTTLRLRDRLRANGHNSEVFASLIDRRLRREAHPPEQLPGHLDDGDAVLYQLSIGSTLARMIPTLRGVHAICYQNISPAASVEPFSPVMAHHLRWGRRDLAALAPLADLCVAPSTYSLDELRAAGARLTAQVRLDVDLRPLRPRPSAPASPPRLLFVGRFAPHKRQDHLIRVLAALRRLHCPDARLVLAGAAAIPAYVDSLRRLADQLQVGDAVDIRSGHQSVAEIGDLYASASVFVCASEHEGFCVPLLESMAFSVPILAYDATAVPETLDGAGMLVRDHDPLLWAELAWRLIRDEPLRRRIGISATERLAAFCAIDPAEQLLTALERVAPRESAA